MRRKSKKKMQIMICAIAMVCVMAIPGFAIEKDFNAFKSNEELEMYREGLAGASEFTPQDMFDATPLTFGESLAGTIGFYDTLYYSFQPTEDNFYILKSEGDTDTRAVLLDSNGDWIHEDDDCGDGYNFLFVRWLEAGQTYYLEVEAYSEGAYTIKVESPSYRTVTGTVSLPGTDTAPAGGLAVHILADVYGYDTYCEELAYLDFTDHFATIDEGASSVEYSIGVPYDATLGNMAMCAYTYLDRSLSMDLDYAQRSYYAADGCVVRGCHDFDFLEMNRNHEGIDIDIIPAYQIAGGILYDDAINDNIDMQIRLHEKVPNGGGYNLEIVDYQWVHPPAYSGFILDIPKDIENPCILSFGNFDDEEYVCMNYYGPNSNINDKNNAYELYPNADLTGANIFMDRAVDVGDTNNADNPQAVDVENCITLIYTPQYIGDTDYYSLSLDSSKILRLEVVGEWLELELYNDYDDFELDEDYNQDTGVWEYSCDSASGDCILQITNFWNMETSQIALSYTDDPLAQMADAARAFGSKSGDSDWDASFDLDGDGMVDIYDLVLLARSL